MKRSRIYKNLLVLFLIFSAGVMWNCARQSADMVLLHGKIVTVDDKVPEAQAIAVREGKILAVGSDAEIRPFISAKTKTIDLQGKLAVPGLIEGHGHFTGLGISLSQLNFMKVKNFDEIVAMVRDAAEKAKPGEWILGRGWHQEKWDKVPRPNVDGLPYPGALSKAAANNPVWLRHASGHAGMANAKAMELAGITKDTPNPAGGEIVKDPKGNPIGVFRENAMGLIGKALTGQRKNRTPAQIEAEQQKIIDVATEYCLAKGITSFEDAGSSFRAIDRFKKRVDGGTLGIRLWVMIGESNAQLKKHIDEYKILHYGDERLTVRAIKRYMDGALGSHGAWMLEPYSDLPASTGLNVTPLPELRESARLAIEHGFQLCTHAIGDRANREVLNIYEEAFKQHPDKKNLRWRVEHAQHLNPADIPRFGQLGVIAAMQAIHCTSDGPWVIERLGEKRAREGAYVWQKLMKTGAVVTNGTDCPVEDPDPIPCYYAAVTRKLKDGSLFYPDQKMSRMEALKSYTIKNAYAAFQEDIKGSLTPGKLADITVLSKDILTVPDDEILQTEVLYTIVGGKVMYEKKKE